MPSCSFPYAEHSAGLNAFLQSSCWTELLFSINSLAWSLTPSIHYWLQCTTTCLKESLQHALCNSFVYPYSANITSHFATAHRLPTSAYKFTINPEIKQKHLLFRRGSVHTTALPQKSHVGSVIACTCPFSNFDFKNHRYIAKLFLLCPYIPCKSGMCKIWLLYCDTGIIFCTA